MRSAYHSIKYVHEIQITTFCLEYRFTVDGT
jgi:hypothetical protein